MLGTGIAQGIAAGLQGYTQGMVQGESLRQSKQRAITEEAIKREQLDQLQYQKSTRKPEDLIQQEFEILKQQNNAMQAELTKKSMYDGFRLYNADGETRHLNNLLKNPGVKKLYPNAARWDKINIATDEGLLRQAGIADNEVTPAFMKNFIKQTDVDGNQKIVNMQEAYTGTGFQNVLTKEEQERQYKEAQIAYTKKQTEVLGVPTPKVTKTPEEVAKMQAETAKIKKETELLGQPKPLTPKEQQAQSDLFKDKEATKDSLDNSINLIDKLIAHPGRAAATGMTFPLSWVPGTKAKDFTAAIETLKSNVFLNAISQMKGFGALSDAEGKKLDASIASLDVSQSEEAFLENLNTIKSQFTKAKAKLGDMQASGDTATKPPLSSFGTL